MLVVNDRVETCLSSPFPAHLKPIVKSVISSGGGNGSYQNQLGLLGCRVEMWKVEVGDFVKYVSQLPSCSDLTNIRNILTVTNARESCAFQIDFVSLKIRSSFVILPEK